jgi:hypothetical protein
LSLFCKNWKGRVKIAFFHTSRAFSRQYWAFLCFFGKLIMLSDPFHWAEGDATHDFLLAKVSNPLPAPTQFSAGKVGNP